MIPVRELRRVDPRPFFDRAKDTNPEAVEAASRIMQEVHEGGDAALLEFVAQLDGVDVPGLWLAEDAWDALADACPPDVRAAIDANAARIRAFHARQVAHEDTMEVAPGIMLGRRPVPFRHAACYVPGGRASYPSTVMMTVIPASLAGVEEIIVATPPRETGVDPAVAYAARHCGAHRILLAGGAHAIGALAFGTESVPAVDVIVGPGNQYVNAAKMLVRHRVNIDSPAGPSELLIIADETAEAGHVVADMLAQAEHDPDAQVILLSTDAALARDVAAMIETEVPRAARSDVIDASLRGRGAIMVGGLAACIDFANRYAAEHLEIITAEPDTVLEQVVNAGSIFLGPYAPVSLGDYGSGTNHVLPTLGHARRTGGLSVDTFRKWITWQRVDEAGLRAVADDITTLADAEGLHGHAEAVRRRLA